MALVYDSDFNIMQQSRGLLLIAELSLVIFRKSDVKLIMI